MGQDLILNLLDSWGGGWGGGWGKAEVSLEPIGSRLPLAQSNPHLNPYNRRSHKAEPRPDWKDLPFLGYFHLPTCFCCSSKANPARVISLQVRKVRPKEAGYFPRGYN